MTRDIDSKLDIIRELRVNNGTGFRQYDAHPFLRTVLDWTRMATYRSSTSVDAVPLLLGDSHQHLESMMQVRQAYADPSCVLALELVSSFDRLICSTRWTPTPPAYHAVAKVAVEPCFGFTAP